MFSKLQDIFNTSKVDKKNIKIKNIKNYIKYLKKTNFKQHKQLEKINEIPSEIIKKVDLNNSLFVDIKIKELENRVPEPFFDISFEIDSNFIQFDLNQTLFVDIKIKEFENRVPEPFFDINFEIDEPFIQFDLNQSLFVDIKIKELENRVNEVFFDINLQSSNFQSSNDLSLESLLEQYINNETNMINLNSINFFNFKNIHHLSLTEEIFDNNNFIHHNNKNKYNEMNLFTIKDNSDLSLVKINNKKNKNNDDKKNDNKKNDNKKNDNKNDKSKTVNFSILNKIKVINNVYKQSYKNKFVTGFGDFLRGCYFILEFCGKFSLEYNISIIHPIKNFLKNKSKTIPQDISDTIEYCDYTNVNLDVNCSFNSDTSTVYHEFFDYLNKQSIFNKNIYLYTICYPTFNISSENKNIVRNLIEPVDEIKISIDLILRNLGLSKKGFEILHIRSGDQYLNKTTKTLDEKYKVNLLDALNKIIDKNNSYLLIADSITVKNFIIKFFPFIKTFFKNITHLGENSKLDDENIFNTLIDFYIFSYSKKVYSISCYEHGSGFSRWSSFTYDVPYHCIKV
jgi:hypothetical protein